MAHSVGIGASAVDINAPAATGGAEAASAGGVGEGGRSKHPRENLARGGGPVATCPPLFEGDGPHVRIASQKGAGWWRGGG
jgi:hypothetical protein